MYKFKNSDFNEYNVYQHSSEFPDEALKRIPERLHKVIDDGVSSFFSDIQKDFPGLFQLLSEKGSPVFLFESIDERELITGETRIRKLYFWGLECGDTAINISIPVRGTVEIGQKLDRPYIESLPEGMECFHKKMDAIYISHPVAFLGGYDLPMSFSSWDPLDNYCENIEISKKKIRKITKDFKYNDLRIIVEGSKGDLVIVDHSKKDKKLYHVKDLDFDNYRLIEDPIKKLDQYFVNAVLGFPEPVQLT